ncbi:unnamed protein product [Caenorhabditis sp. 36 PRJEB53466]|nr:unnamed protein product [Caenorhabditis sp. 36 PRJEB53466]
MSDPTEQDPDFELVDGAERKSSTSDSFEAVDDKKTDSQSVSENEEEDAEKTLNDEKEVEEEKPQLPFVDQSILDDANRPVEKDGEQLVEDALNAPIRPDQEQFYTPEHSNRAITLLIGFSALMFTVPLLVMASLYYWVFIDYFHMPPADAMLYAGIGAAIAVILIAAAFCYVAWKEEKDAEDKLKAEKKSDEMATPVPASTLQTLLPNFRDQEVQSAVKNLLAYSLVILIVPLASMFLLKQYFFEALLGFAANDALTYSAIIAVILSDAHDEPVNLGFGLEIDPDELYRLRSQFLPLGKIGGKPAWLNPKTLPKSSDLLCKVCQKPLCFLMQVSANGGPSDPEHAFHRSLFLFVCRDATCSRANDAANLKAFRCQLPRSNAFYSFDGPMDADLDGDVPDPRALVDGPALCRICGCLAAKKCAKCQVARYCSQAHQVIDWPAHKLECAQAAADGMIADEPRNPRNAFVFKEFGVEIDQEYVPSNLFHGLSDDESDEEEEEEEGGGETDETEEEKRARLREFEKFCEKNKGKNIDMTKEDLDAATAEQKKDTDFERFNRLVALNPDQIVRYKRHGVPLRATCQSELPETVEPCELCGAPRRFEMQLMPHLLSLIDVDAIGQSIDWASVYVYTCSASCQIADDGYAREFVAKQDFL